MHSYSKTATMIHRSAAAIFARGSRLALGLSVVSAALGCGAAPEDMSGDPGESVSQPLAIAVTPTGTTCGLGYYKDGRTVDAGFCKGFATLQPQRWTCGWPAVTCMSPGTAPAAPGTHRTADGDRGLGTFWGFYHQTIDPSVASGDTGNSASYVMPKGTACGFKEACNNSGERCMGFDANVSCPNGYIRRVASDMNAPSGCGFVWCEYQDPNSLCVGDCGLTQAQVPSGTACGVTDNDRQNGFCLGHATHVSCPPGWQRHGFYDDGRGAGRGVGWCAKP